MVCPFQKRPMTIRQPLPAPSSRKVDEEKAPKEVLQENIGPLHKLLNKQIYLEKELNEKLKMKDEQLKTKDEKLRIRHEELRMKHEELKLREQALKLKDIEIERLKKLMDKKSNVILRQRKELKRLNASKNYYKSKLLSMMETLVEELIEPDLISEERNQVNRFHVPKFFLVS